jgi:hypothetical protein
LECPASSVSSSIIWIAQCIWSALKNHRRLRLMRRKDGMHLVSTHSLEAACHSDISLASWPWISCFWQIACRCFRILVTLNFAYSLIH